MQEANPPKVTCPTLPSSILVKPDSPHTQCRQVGAAGVGDAKLIAQGIVDAVDVYGWVDVPMQVCFRSQGRLKFLDASTAPRTVSDLAVERIDGMTCGQIDRVGTVVLLPGGDSAQETAVVASDSPPAPAATGPSSTTSCELETTGYLSLRAGPSTTMRACSQCQKAPDWSPGQESATGSWSITKGSWAGPAGVIWQPAPVAMPSARRAPSFCRLRLSLPRLKPKRR